MITIIRSKYDNIIDKGFASPISSIWFLAGLDPGLNFWEGAKVLGGVPRSKERKKNDKIRT